MPRIELTLSDEARASLAARPRVWVKAELRYKDQVLRDVGVRLKGHRSMRRLADQKPSIKIRTDKFVDGQVFFGLSRLTLNAMVEDPTLVRETLGYRLYREMGVPAPDTGFAELVIDGELYGLYLWVENVDQSFFDRRFGNHDGVLYEGEYGCDLYLDDVDGFERDLGPKGRKDLRRLARAAGGPLPGLLGGPDALLDESVFAYLAVSAFLGDYDGYRHAHNYHLYFRPETGKWYFIPWGIDRVFQKRLDALRLERAGGQAVLCR